MGPPESDWAGAEGRLLGGRMGARGWRARLYPDVLPNPHGADSRPIDLFLRDTACRPRRLIGPYGGIFRAQNTRGVLNWALMRGRDLVFPRRPLPTNHPAPAQTYPPTRSRGVWAPPIWRGERRLQA